MVYLEEYPKTSKLVRSEFIVSFVALGIGALFGIIQALHRTGIFRGVVSSADYYTILTGHGVLLALVFTTFFIAGLFAWAVSNSLERELPMRLSWAAFWLMLVGTVLAAVAVLGGVFGAPEILGHSLKADVLFTFYAPMKAHPAFYLGAALIIVGSWIAGGAYFKSLWEWRSEHPGERIPLRAFMVVTTMLMWYISTIGVAVEVVVFLIPWSLGLIQNVDPLLTRTLFWYFGHPVVYFWLMPAYLVWYTVLPKLAGGRLFSDPLARVVFVLFLLLSTPVGFHHQYVDPGIPEGFKFIAMTNTMFLLLPSLLTAFTVVASVEHAARQRGATGYVSWIRDLPWGKPAFSGCMLAGLMFAAGGFSGMINAGMNINYLIHNTLWVPGHFHLTVGTAFALTAMAISYWLVPQLTGKRLRRRTVAVAQPYVWFIGMALMSNAMHRAGLAGIPRRTAEPTYDEFAFEGVAGTVGEMRLQIAVGGFVLFLGATMFLWVMAETFLAHRGGQLAVSSKPLNPLSGPEHSPRVLDNYKLWTAIALVLIVIAYGPPLASMVVDGILAPGSPPIPV